MSSVEILVILAVRTFNFAVVPRNIRFYELVFYATLFRAAKPLGELSSVVGSNALYFEFEGLWHMVNENS